MAISESWLKPGDEAVINDITPAGYSIQHVHRPSSKRGGGLALLYKSGLTVRRHDIHPAPKSFECLNVELINTSLSISLLLIYRPQTKSTGCSFSAFSEEFSNIIDQFLLNPMPILITGDFNTHVNDSLDSDACSFARMLSSSGLHQHVSDATHKAGHTLDLLITRTSDIPVFSKLQIIDGLSDHKAIMCDLMLDKPPTTTKVIFKRHINAIDNDKFCDDIVASDLFHPVNKCDLETKVHRYNNILKTLLDKHAPCKQATVKIRPNCLWYTDAIHTEKQNRRHLERVWRRSQLEGDRRLYQEQKQKVNHMMATAKSNYYKELFLTNSKDQKQLFKLTSRLLHRGRVSPPS